MDRPSHARQLAPAFALTIAVAGALALAVALGGCSRGTTTRPIERPRPAQEPTSTEPTRAPVAPPPALADLEIRLEPVLAGLDAPLFVTHAGDGSGRLFVVEQGGLIRAARDGKLASRPFLDVRSKISTGGERGLLGLAFAPDYEDNGRFYVNYTDTSGDTVVARYAAEDPASDSPALSQPEIVLTIDQPYANHNGGCIVFAPDGTLWVGMGDGGSAGDPQDRAQDPGERLGKMLSLDVEASKQPRPRVVLSGLRNPWRFSFDRETDDLWIGDVGQGEWEEIDLVSFAGAEGTNFGWNLWEGAHPYPPGAKPSRSGFRFPVIEYDHDEGYSVTGGYVYRGERYPDLRGTYLYADFGSGFVAGARVTDDGEVEERVLLRDSGTTPSSFGEDEAGEVYLVDYNGRVLRVAAGDAAQ